jgi:hypothetical protein
LVRRFRKLREALTSLGCRDAWAAEVYELSADACALAGNTAELLKCLQALVNTLYPAVEAQEARGAGRQLLQQGQQHHQQQQRQQQRQQQQQQRQQRQQQQRQQQQQQQQQAEGRPDPWDDAGTSCSGGRSAPDQAAAAGFSLQRGASWDGRGPSEAAAAAPTQHAPAGPLARRAEVHAALLLWFLCVPARPVAAEVAKRLRATPPEVVGSRDMQLALRAASALMRGNWVRLWAAARAAPPLVARVLQAGAPAARGRAARAAAAAYRVLPLGVFAGALGLEGGGCGRDAAAVRAALERAKDNLGSRWAGVALERLDGGDCADLAFR